MDSEIVSAVLRDYNRDAFACKNYPHVSKATPPTCTVDCKTCASQFHCSLYQELIPYTTKLADHDAAKAIADYIELARENIAKLQNLIQEHGNVIRKRWMKRNAKQRAALATATAYRMYRNRWAQAHNRKDYFNRIAGNELMGMYHPFLSHELLTQDPTKLLCLLHARTTYGPEEWIMHDIMAQERGWSGPLMPSFYNPHCVVVAPGDEFGKLVAWDAEKAHRWEIVGFPRAQSAFAGQAQISCMLADITAALVGDLSTAPRGRDVWDAAAALGFQDELSVTPSPYWDVPFIAPPRFDTSRIRDLIQRASDKVREHFHSLQTDWRYFRSFLVKLQESKYAQSLGPSERYQYLTDSLLRIPQRLDDLVRTLDEANVLLDILDASESITGTGESLSDEYSLALRTLQKLLSSRSPLPDIKHVMPKIGAFEQYFFQDIDGLQKCVISPAQALKRDPLFWNIRKIVDNDDMQYHLAYIEDICAKSSTEKSRLGDVMDYLLADLALLDEAKSMMRYHKPYPGDEMTKEEFLAAAERFKLNTASPLTPIAVGHATAKLQEKELAALIKEFLDLPLPPRKASYQSIRKTVDLQLASGKLWIHLCSMRVDLVSQLGLTEKEAQKYSDDYVVFAPDTRENHYIDELQPLALAIRGKTQASKARTSSNLSGQTPSSPAQTEWGRTTDANAFTVSKPKEKIKRRSSVNRHEDEVGAVTQRDEQPGPDPVRIAVTSASLELLTRMFTPHLTAKGTADTRWEYFVSTMADTGCQARANGGCAVTFLWEGKRCTVHRPHPNPTINPIMLGSFGRKLSNGFGWGLDMFVERAKQPR